MSDGSRVLVAYYEELVGGVPTYKGVPSPLTLLNLRNVNEGIEPVYGFIESQEVTSDRTTADTTMADFRARGPINGEFSYATYDDFMRWVLAADSTWSTAQTITGTGLTVTAVNKFTSTVNPSGIAAGDWIRTRNFPNAANNGWFYVQSIAGAGPYELTVRPNTLVVDATTSASAELKSGARIRNGSTFASFGIERDYGTPLATAQRFVNIPGGVVEAIQLGFAPRQINNIRIDVLAADEVSRTATIGTTANTVANLNPVMNSIRNVKAFRVDQAPIKVRSLTMTIRNALRERPAISVFGLDDIALGPINAEIAWEAYYVDKTHANAARNETEIDLSVVLEDNVGNGYVLYMPRTKIESASRIGGGKNTDVLMRCRARALKGNNEMMQIARFPN